ncbi:phosphatase PAP2 family protein [Pseudomonas sp. 2FG]|uniref:phosphatase PAP2 family protein n=1 Tax=Pseudomonas sp. 2FG TaxID=2502191 RepID=UPI0010F591B4|nr:phosphatase PAP2 family protein [Pseudomonas sp. 2FG]
MLDLLHNLDWVLPLRSDWLTPLMRLFTLLGYEKFILFFLPLGYWAWSKSVFMRLFVLVAITAVLNAYLKDLWQDPRPDLALRMDHAVGDSFGMPSGHAQIAVVLWLWLAYEVRRPWFWLLSGVVVTGIIFSRLYLGAHDLEDVLAGALLGGVTLLLFAQVKNWSWWRQANALWHLALITVVALLCSFTWQGVAPNYVPLLTGLLAGVLFGYRQVGFATATLWWKRALAAALGALAFIGLQALLKWLGPQLALQPLFWQGIRGLTMGLFVAALMPWLLLRLRLLPARETL